MTRLYANPSDEQRVEYDLENCRAWAKWFAQSEMDTSPPHSDPCTPWAKPILISWRIQKLWRKVLLARLSESTWILRFNLLDIVRAICTHTLLKKRPEIPGALRSPLSLLKELIPLGCDLKANRVCGHLTKNSNSFNSFKFPSCDMMTTWELETSKRRWEIYIRGKKKEAMR